MAGVGTGLIDFVLNFELLERTEILSIIPICGVVLGEGDSRIEVFMPAIVPTKASCLRLISAFLVETAERWQSGRTHYDFTKITCTHPKAAQV